MNLMLFRKPVVLLALLGWPCAAFAQPDAASLQAALKLRESTARAVKEKTDTVGGAIAKLKAHASPSGLKLDRDADFALAALDVGQRLVADGDPESAEPFFREAEKSLNAVIKKTADSTAREKAAFLQKRALVRSQFLGQAKEAKADLEAALALQPDDEGLKRAQARLRAEHGQLFTDEQPKG